LKELKYFLSYAAYSADNVKDFFNDIVYIDEEIDMKLIESIQDSLLNKMNDGKITYFAVQIISINKI
jgi:hypothetical protein